MAEQDEAPAKTGAAMAAPHTKRLAGAAGVMMASILLSRILGFVREAIISGKLGQGAASDVYMAAFLLPDTLFFLIAGGALSSAFIPVFTEMLARGHEDRAWKLFSTVASVMFVIVAAFVVGGFILARPLVGLLAYGLKPELLDQVVPLTRIVLPAQLCFFLGGLMMGAQQARGRFLLPGLGPNIYNLGIIAGGILLVDRLGAAGLCWGALMGAVLGNFLLQAYGMRLEGARFRICFDWRDEAVLRVGKLMLPVILGLALPQVSILLNRIFATSLGEGPMSALTRANTLMQAPLAIFGQSLSIAVFPTLSAQATLADWRRYGDTIGLGIRFILFLTVPATALLIVLGKPIIAVLLQHGRFTGANTAETAIALSNYALGLFAWSGQAVLARGFYAMQDTKTPVIIGTLVTIVFVPLNFLFMHGFRMGFAGLALATSVAASMNFVVMLAVLHSRLRRKAAGADLGPVGLDLGRLGVSSARIAVASVLAGAVAWLVLQALTKLGHHGPATLEMKLESLLALGVGGGGATVAYLGVARLLRMEELAQLRGILRRRTPSGASSDPISTTPEG